MSSRSNPLYYSPIYIPIAYSRRYGRAYDNAGWRGVMYLTYASSIDDAFDYPYYDSFEFNGPGYLGYLFYMIYDMNVMYNVYLKISESLLRSDLDRIRSRMKSRLPYLRKAFQELFTRYELSFMKEFDWNLSRFLSRMIYITFEKEVKNDYYIREFKAINTYLSNTTLKYNFTQEAFQKFLRRIIRFGIGISLAHRIRLMEYVSFFYYARDVLNGYEYEDLINGYKLFNYLSDKYCFDFLIDKGLYPHRYNVIVWKSRLELGGKSSSEITFYGDSCIFPLFVNRIPSIYRTSYKAGDIMKTLMPICKVCRSLLGSFIVSKGFNVSISDHRVRNSQCRIVYSVYREGLHGVESEFT